MAGTVPTIAKNDYLTTVYKSSTAYAMGLMTNASFANQSLVVLADITEPTGGGYARNTLVTNDFTVANGAASVTSTFTPTGAAYNQQVTGYFIVNTTVNRIHLLELYPAPVTTIANQPHEVRVTITG